MRKMSELKSPVQPFIVRHKGALSALQMQSLVQLYQPIIGMDAVNLYLLLFQQPVNEHKISTQKVHSSLFPYIAGSLGKIDEARLNLEAVGLIETYKQTTEGVIYPTLLYDMQYPLLIKEFIDNPLLSNALINQLSEVGFFEIVRQWEIAPIEIAEYEEVTVSFETVFNPTQTDYQTLAYEAKQGYELQGHDQQPPIQTVVEDFDYGKILRKLVEQQVNHQVLGPKLKQEVLAIRTVYHYDEALITQLLLASYEDKIPAINYQDLKIAAQKHHESHRANSSFLGTQTAQVGQSGHNGLAGQSGQVNQNAQNAQNAQTGQIAQTGRNTQIGQAAQLDQTTQNLDGQSNQSIIKNTEIETLKSQYPQFSAQQIELMAICEKVSPESMLNQIKESKQGFVSSNEMEYLKNIANRSRLPQSVQTYLVYYLLMILNRVEFQKGESERIANLWQQEQLLTLPKAMAYVQQQRKAQAIKKKQQDNRRPYTPFQKNKKVERTPYWAQEATLSEDQSTVNANQNNVSNHQQAGQTTSGFSSNNANDANTQKGNQQPITNHNIDQNQPSEVDLRNQLEQLFERGREE